MGYSAGASVIVRPRTRSLSRAALPIVAVVSASAVLRVAASRWLEAPWIAPDEMIYGLLGRSLWAGDAALLGEAAPFYGGYALLVGLPLHLLDVATAVTAIQIGQSILVSLTAGAVWAWARPFAGKSWALVAAALTACLPALAYSGLLMTEAVFLPAATVALWLMARAIVNPSRGSQAALLGAVALATATRLQAVVLIPTLVTAALLAAWFARDRRIVTRLTPIWAALSAIALGWVGYSLAADGNVSGALGAYSGTLGSGYDVGDALRFVLYHAGDVFLLVLGVPLVALGVLAYGAARGREADSGVSALVAVTLAVSFWLPLQVGVFASRYVGHLAERDLIMVAPPLLVCFAVWLARGAPRPQPATSMIAFAIAVPAVLLPVRELATPFATPDSFMIIPVQRLLGALSPDVVDTAWLIVAVALVAAAVAVPRRAAAVLPVLVGLGLAATSVIATAEIKRLAHIDDVRFFGGASRTWVDDAATDDVAYLYDGSAYWNGVWKTAFWNERIRTVVRLPGPLPSPLPSRVVSPRFDGALVTERGLSLETRQIVAPSAFTFVGTQLAEVVQRDLDESGLRLWRTAGPPKLSTWTTGLEPNGDILEPIRVNVYACGPGQLELTLLGKQGTPVEIDLDGVPALRLELASETVWSGSIPTPAGANGRQRCTFEIRSTGLVGSTRIEFVRAS